MDYEDAFSDFFTGPYHDEVQDLDEVFPEERSLRIDWADLHDHDGELAKKILRQPKKLREYADEALRLVEDVSLTRANVRVHNLPSGREYRVGKYRTPQLGKLIAVSGEVVDMTGVQPYAEKAAFECQRCGTLTRIPQTGGDLVSPSECRACESGPQHAMFKFHRDQSDLVDHQEIYIIPLDTTLDDPPGTVVFLKDDLCDMIGPGDHLQLTGVYEAFPQQDEVTLSTYIDAWDFEIEERVETDAYETAEIREFIMDAVTGLLDDADDFSIERERIIESVVEKYGVRREEVQTQIDKLVDENELGESGEGIFDI